MADDNELALDWPLEASEPGREVWYGLVGKRDGSAAFWYRFTLLSTTSGHQEGRLWAALTRREGTSTFTSAAVGTEAVRPAMNPFSLTLGDGKLTSRSARADIDGDPGAAWSLDYRPDAYTFRPLRSRRLTHLLSVLMGTGKHWSRNQTIQVTGTTSVGNHSIAFEDAPGHQGHTLGSDPPESWTWVHCNAFEDADETDVVLEALDLDGTLSVCLRRAGRIHALNRLPHVLRGNRTEHNEPGEWRFQARGDGVELEATVSVPGHWQRVAYCAPDETVRYNAHCSVANVTLTYRIDGGDARTVESNGARAEWVETQPPVDGTYRPDWDAVLGR